MSDPIKDGGMAVDMSVRDQFAEKFAVALIALSQLCKDENEMSENMRRTPGLAYELAVAMLAEREKVLESARKYNSEQRNCHPRAKTVYSQYRKDFGSLDYSKKIYCVRERTWRMATARPRLWQIGRAHV